MSLLRMVVDTAHCPGSIPFQYQVLVPHTPLHTSSLLALQMHLTLRYFPCQQFDQQCLLVVHLKVAAPLLEPTLNFVLQPLPPPSPHLPLLFHPPLPLSPVTHCS